MPEKISVESHNLCRYLEIHKIVEWRDKCVFKTKPLGHIKYEDEKEVLKLKWLGKPKYTVSAISTRISSNKSINPILNVYKVEELL